MSRGIFKSLIILALTISTFCSCSISSNVDIPNGYIDKVEYFQEEGVQDYTDYCKYVYESSELFLDNKDYKIVETSEIDNIKAYFDNFELCMESAGRIEEYNFDTDHITQGDYVRLMSKYDDDIFANYTIYFFDSESKILYYLHSNI